ncbi:MAG: hypothetical protein WA900_06635, partial [Casimicrobiaceae bacterium]
LERPVDAHTRAVVRFWQVADVIAQDAPAPRPLWVGMVTLERLDPARGLIETARTLADFDTPLAIFAGAVAGLRTRADTRADGGASVLLVW